MAEPAAACRFEASSPAPVGASAAFRTSKKGLRFRVLAPLLTQEPQSWWMGGSEGLQRDYGKDVQGSIYHWLQHAAGQAGESLTCIMKEGRFRAVRRVVVA